ncbi:MAG: hypothetical protein HFI66_07555 [Lachnospiraceae bacterium]|jgi:hypothetical protein|nr:hypothetical protein [Lachnospiraceae bacterium]
MRQTVAVARFNFRGFFKNPKVILTLLLSVILCYLLSARVMEVIEAYGTPVQLAEPFLWTFGDAYSVLLSSILLILLFSDLPMVSGITPYYLYRTTRGKWLAGQMLYVAGVVLLYTGFLFGVTVLLCGKYSYLGDKWSETAAMLAYSKLGEELGVPSTVKVMESITPYGCMLQVLGLLFLYALVLSFLILAGNLRSGKNRGMAGGLLFSLYGLLLNRDVIAALFGWEKYEGYRANLLIGWLSPLSHATYGKHSFGYDRLPSLSASRLVFTGLLFLFAGISLRAGKRYSFAFLGESSYTHGR